MLNTKKIVALAALLLMIPLSVAGAEREDVIDQVAHNPKPQVVEPGQLRIRKSIQQLDEELFEITLDIDTHLNLENIVSNGISAVLVVDNSGSMREELSNGKNKSDALKEAAFDFVDVFLGGDSNPDNEIAVVAYESNIDEYGCFPFNSGARNKEPGAAKQALDYSISPFYLGTTNIQIAMKRAREYMTQANNDKKVIILFSDGAPNFGYNGVAGERTDRIININNIQYDFYVTDFGTYQPFTGYTVAGRTVNSVDENFLIATVSEGLIAEDNGIEMFTVLATSNGLSTNERMRAEFVMGNMASGTANFFEVDNVSGLIAAFEEIAADLEKGDVIYIVEDPMGFGITFHGVKSEQSVKGKRFPNVRFYSHNETILWDLTNTTISPEKITEDGYNYRYTLKYTVAFNSGYVRNNDPEFHNSKEYPTNNITTLYYHLPNVKNARSVEFDIPRVVPLPVATGAGKPQTGEGDTELIIMAAVMLIASVWLIKRLYGHKVKKLFNHTVKLKKHK